MLIEDSGKKNNIADNGCGDFKMYMINLTDHPGVYIF